MRPTDSSTPNRARSSLEKSRDRIAAARERGRRAVLPNPKYEPRPSDPTFLYAIQAKPSGKIKLGISTDPERRRREMAASHYETLEIIAFGPGDLGDEVRMHGPLLEHRIRGEWYEPHPAVWEAVIRVVYGLREEPE